MNRRGINLVRAARGFSLLELTLVLAIIGLLMAVTAYSIFGQGEQAKVKTTLASMKTIKNAIQQYNLNTSSYPPDLSALQTGRAPYLDPDKKMIDGWGAQFIYGVPGHDGHPFDLYSKGSDGTLGTPDDISVWVEPTNQ
jgi:general secretion pathway protein G